MNPQNGQTPLDYLNQIAPQAPKKQPFRLTIKTVLLGAVVAIILIIILVIVANSVAASRKAPWQQLSARLKTTQSIAEDSTKYIKNSQLRTLNSSLRLHLTNTRRDLADPLARLGISTSKLPESITAKESATAITDRLTDARMNAKFDSTYAREMSYKLSTILALYQQLYKTSGGSTREFLKTAYDNLEPTQRGLAEFSASNE